MAKAPMSVKARGAAGGRAALRRGKSWTRREKSAAAAPRFRPDLAPDADLV
jgi:hypothetical protein